MDLIPVRSVGHETEKEDVVILVPKFESAFIHRLFPQTREMYHRIRLDNIGSNTWEFIDGEKNVQQIADNLRKTDGLDKDSLIDLEERMSKFMMMLYERKYITFKQII